MIRGQENLQKCRIWKAESGIVSKAVLNTSEQNRNVKNLFTCRNYAFTLAEVLITLAIIGVISAITMPMLITNINERVNSERHANIAYKITQAMEQMHAHGKLVQYSSTDAFVDELQKYLKIQKRCSASNIAECWPTETVTDASGEEYIVADCKQRKNLLPGSDSEDNNVGLILADGASIILTYDTETQGLDIGTPIKSTQDYYLPVGNGKYKKFAYTTSVTGAIDFVTDVNGKRGPNSETRDNKYYDIRQFRSAAFSNTIIPKECYNEVCIKYLAQTYESVNCTNENSSSKDYKNFCGNTPSGFENDYWAGAQKECAMSKMKLPNITELRAIYNNRANYPSLASNGLYFWTSEEDSQTWANFKFFSDGQEGYWGYKANHHAAFCVDK